MNWKKLIIGITTVNLFGWIMLELWSKRYATSNISIGAGILIFTHLVGYYIIVLASRIKVKPAPEKITPLNCPGHDWQKDEYSSEHYKKETCVKCGAKRGG